MKHMDWLEENVKTVEDGITLLEELRTHMLFTDMNCSSDTKEKLTELITVKAINDMDNAVHNFRIAQLLERFYRI